jgi:hypothetical protein
LAIKRSFSSATVNGLYLILRFVEGISSVNIGCLIFGNIIFHLCVIM